MSSNGPARCRWAARDRAGREAELEDATDTLMDFVLHSPGPISLSELFAAKEAIASINIDNDREGTYSL